MDPVLADFLSDVAIITAGVLTGVLVARITASRTRDLERERRRLDLCAVLLRDVETLRDQGRRQALGQPLQDWGEAQDRAHSALTQLRITDPDLEPSAMLLWHAAQRVVEGAQLRRIGPGMPIPPDLQDWKRLDTDYDAAHEGFRKAARQKLR